MELGSRGGAVTCRGEEVLDDFRVDDGASVCDAVERVREVPHTVDAVFEEITDRTLRESEEPSRVRIREVLREHHDGLAGKLGADAERGEESVAGVGRWHSHVGNGSLPGIYRRSLTKLISPMGSTTSSLLGGQSKTTIIAASLRFSGAGSW